MSVPQRESAPSRDVTFFFFPIFFYHIKVLCWYLFNFPKIFFFFFFQYLFAYLAVPGLSCGRYVGSRFLTRDQTLAPCIGSVES